MNKDIVLVAHNIRSTHNVGSLIRTCEGLGVKMVYLTGYTPYPSLRDDDRLPHLAHKISKQIHKTALGAEQSQAIEHQPDINKAIRELKNQNYQIAALEQTKKSVSLLDFKAEPKIALIVGREVEGIESEVLDLADDIVEIPMFGKKESFNVAQAAAMVLYHLRFVA
jgi:23S rRNA (guanosine2251-2'-O)-methyltransferase